MTTASPDDLNRRIKELERETREEELRQLKANAKVRWITPAALAALLPLLGGLALWIVSEVKQYGEGYQALKDKAGLERDKETLQKQKDGLNIEISTLLQLKAHYADQARRLSQDVEAKQEIMDKTYLRAVFLSSETIYALGHVTALGVGPDRKTLEAMQGDVRTLPKESAGRVLKLLDRCDLMDDMFDVSRRSVGSFQQALNLLPASDWTKRLRYEPSGAILSGRNIMSGDGPDGERFYDITEGRFLTKEEAKGARGR